jgi:hypothetical protein
MAEVGVAFVAEEDVAAADVLVLVGGVGGVPVVAGEFVVGAGEEVVALGSVLADEEDEGWLVAFAGSGGPPFLAKPRREAKETPEGGAAACCAQGRNP